MSSPSENETTMASADQAMSRYAQGDAASFAVVYDAVAPRLERHLGRHVRDRAKLADIIQQTFLQMHCARGTFVLGAEVLPWAFAIARRLMIDVYRASRRDARLDLDDDDGARPPPSETPFAARVPNGEEEAAAREVGTRLFGAYGRLTEPQRAAFELVKWDGLSHAQAAAVLGTSVTGVKLRVHRVYLALRSALEGAHAAAPDRGRGGRAARVLTLAGGE
jgi:RNA polymerase sigma-70 factor (ECF subfamily)